MAEVRFDQVCLTYPGAERPAVDALDLTIDDGEFMVLVGPSGCGKSSSLRMLAGLEPATSGAISIGDREVTDVAPRDRDIAMVFQNYALYPHLSVADNMGFALKIAGVSRAERNVRVREAAEMLDLVDVLGRKPKGLSGGQRQRVAMGRAIVRQPQVFCMDEPLSNLDAKLRVSTRTQIAALQRRLGVTTVYVTHDQVEAMTMGDRVAVLSEGRLQQVDTPLGLYDRPANAFVAGFIGSPAMNLLSGKTSGDGSVFVDGVPIPVPPGATASARSAEVTVGIRPESWRVGASGDVGYPVTVQVVEELGADAYLYATPADTRAPHGAPLEAGVVSQLVARVDGRAGLVPGQEVVLVPDVEMVHLFDGETGARLVG